eukprot:m.136605 g.136605  ORF g.136605 m.136605 type:complete len:867 (-) comp10776_c0_seq1:175-2775(-)
MTSMNDQTPLLVHGSTNSSLDDGQPLMDGDVGGALRKKKGLSLFFGVFVPCVLTIFSVILFLRLGFVLGQAGVAGTMMMLFLAYAVVGLTILSISAISTNGIVKGGGAYYMISRSLGPEFGGSIGIIFYFANVCGAALYIAGFVESLVDNFESLPDSTWYVFAYSTGVLAFCLIICLIGAGAFAKASFLIFVVVMASIISVFVSFGVVGERHIDPPPQNNDAANLTLIYTGFNSSTFKENIKIKFTNDYSTNTIQNFQVVFAVLFNGCTGIMAGANMSGDLANPTVSIPWGTLLSSAFTLLTYIALFLLSAATCSRELLLNDYNYLEDINVKGPLVTMGIFSATLSAGLTSLIGASRILEAISRDRILGGWMRIFSKEKGNPYAAVFATWFMIQLVLFVGQINVIAPIVSMLFLLSYAVMNWACFVLRVQASPNFRPTFRYFSWHTALLGAISCVGVMFYSNPLYAGLSFVLMIILFLIISFRDVPDWGDSTQALLFHQVRKYLLLLKESPISLKYWRPHILFLVTNPRHQFAAASFVNCMKKGGLYFIAHVITGEFSKENLDRASAVKNAWYKLAQLIKWKSFVDVTIARSVREGVQTYLTSGGMGALRPNIVCMTFIGESHSGDQLQAHIEKSHSESKSRLLSRSFDETKYSDISNSFPSLEPSEMRMNVKEYTAVIRDALLAERAVLITRNFSQLQTRLEQHDTKYIDIYPVINHISDSATFEFIVQMATIAHMVKPYNKFEIRVFCIVNSSSQLDSEKEMVEILLKDFRVVNATVVPIVYDSTRPFAFSSIHDQYKFINRNILANSSETAVVFSYLDTPPEDEGEAAATDYIDNINVLSNNSPPICMLHGVHQVVTSCDNAV